VEAPSCGNGRGHCEVPEELKLRSHCTADRIHFDSCKTLNVSSNVQRESSKNITLKPREQHFQQLCTPYCKAANNLKLQ
jgi:hypothetical protein